MNKINLMGMKEINEFLSIVQPLDSNIELVNPVKKYRVSAKSTLSVIMAASEWGDDIWVESDSDIYSLIEKFIVIAAGDGNGVHY